MAVLSRELLVADLYTHHFKLGRSRESSSLAGPAVSREHRGNRGDIQNRVGTLPLRLYITLTTCPQVYVWMTAPNMRTIKTDVIIIQTDATLQTL